MSQRAGVALVGAMIAAAALIWYGRTLQRDLEYSPHVDESTFVHTSLRMVDSGDFDPHWYGHPASTMIYPLAALFRVLGPVGSLRHDAVARAPRFFLTGRILSTSFAVVGLVLLFLMVRRCFDTPTGLMAALFLLPLPVVVMWTTLARSDGASLCFAVLALDRSLRVLQSPTRRSWLWAGAAFGLAIATKYDLALLGTILIIAWARRRQWLDGLLAIAAGVGSFVAAAPFAAWHVRDAWTHLATEATVAPFLPSQPSHWRALGWYLEFIPDALGWPMCAAALAGALLAVKRRQLPALALAATCGAFLAGISLPRITWERWVIPCLPCLAALAAYAAMGTAGGAARALRRERLKWPFAAALAALLAWQPISVSAVVRTTTTRTEVRQWLFAHLPSGTQVAFENDHGYFVTSPFGETDLDEVDAYHGDVRLHIRLLRGGLPSRPSPESYRCLGDTWAVVNETLRLRSGWNPAFYQQLAREGVKRAEIVPQRTRGGPHLIVYDLSALPCR